MEVFEAIAKRHSYRGAFTGKSVSKDELTRIMQAGIQAPSGKNEQTTTFVVVEDRSLIEQTGEILGKPKLKTAGAVIACLIPRPGTQSTVSFAVEDCAAAVQNILLAITALGYASVWIDGALRVENRAERIASILGVPADREVRIILPVGVPVEPVQPPEKKPLHQRVWFNKYGIP